MVSQTEQEMILSRMLDKALRRSNAVDTESLCIIAGAKCWSLRADVHVLDHDGGLVDASCISVLGALRHFRLPDVSVDGNDVTIYPPAEREPVPLSLMRHTLCVTFSYYYYHHHHSQQDGGGGGGSGQLISLIDANLAEEQARDGDMTIAITEHGELCQMTKPGGLAVDAYALLDCTTIALAKVKQLSAIINSSLERDIARRNPAGVVKELTAENDR